MTLETIPTIPQQTFTGNFESDYIEACSRISAKPMSILKLGAPQLSTSWNSAQKVESLPTSAKGPPPSSHHKKKEAIEPYGSIGNVNMSTANLSKNISPTFKSNMHLSNKAIAPSLSNISTTHEEDENEVSDIKPSVQNVRPASQGQSISTPVVPIEIVAPIKKSRYQFKPTIQVHSSPSGENTASEEYKVEIKGWCFYEGTLDALSMVLPACNTISTLT